MLFSNAESSAPTDAEIALLEGSNAPVFNLVLPTVSTPPIPMARAGALVTSDLQDPQEGCYLTLV